MKAAVDWEIKKEELLSNGVEIRLMKECVWTKKMKNDPGMSQIKTKMPRILKNDTEDSLLEAILNDEVFGFAVCSVKTDPKDIAEMEKVSILIMSHDLNFS